MRIFDYQAAILSALFNNTSTVNGNIIADYTNQSLKTIRKEIEFLNEEIQEFGCNIISRPGTGYELEVTDRKKFVPFRSEIANKYRNSLYYLDAQEERVHYITRCFLTRKSLYIKDMMEECKCSESSIRRDMPLIKNVLSKYKLTIVNRTNKGMFIEGDEWHIRLATIIEHYYYENMERVYFVDDEPQYEKRVLYNKKTRKELIKLIDKLLKENNYSLSYAHIKKYTMVFLISVIRVKYDVQLTINEKLRNIDIKKERKIINEILDNFQLFKNIEFNENSYIFLGILLKGFHLMRYTNEFLLIPERKEIQTIVDNFFIKLRSIYNLHDADIQSLYRDLCISLYRFKYLSILDVHEHEKAVNQFVRNSMFNLDLAALLYQYLKDEVGWNIDKNDIASIYYTFVNFNLKRNDVIRKKILIISRMGYFYSRTVANLMNSRKSNELVEFVPIEYMYLTNDDIDECIGIMTDIERIGEDYPNVKISDIELHRSRRIIDRISQSFILSKEEFSHIFNEDDIYYTNKIKNEDDIFSFVEKVVLKDYENASNYVLESKIKRCKFGNVKTNCVYVVGAFNDYLKENIVKIICLDKAIEINNKNINKILVLNIKDNDMFTRSSILNLVTRTIHSFNTLITHDKKRDYKHIISIMYDD